MRDRAPSRSPRRPAQPQIDDALPDAPERALWLVDDGELSGVLLNDPQARQAGVDRLRFDAVRVVGGSFASAALAGAHWSDVEFEAVDLAGLQMHRGQVRRALFDGCRLTGALVTDVTWQEITFADCRADEFALRFCRGSSMRFEGCDLRQADFTGSDLSGATFSHCDLTLACFDQSTTVGARFEKCTLHGLRGAAGLRGAHVPVHDLPAIADSLAQALGVVVVE